MVMVLAVLVLLVLILGFVVFWFVSSIILIGGVSLYNAAMTTTFSDVYYSIANILLLHAFEIFTSTHVVSPSK